MAEPKIEVRTSYTLPPFMLNVSVPRNKPDALEIMCAPNVEARVLAVLREDVAATVAAAAAEQRVEGH
jgi:hypothetical protein